MDIAEIKKRLKESRLKMTLPRKRILEIFLAKDQAVSYTELLQLTEQAAIDRVTIYRTLRTFEQISLVHRVYNTAGNEYYALSGVLAGQHLHFCCIVCKGVFCLDERQIPAIALPVQYQVISLEMTITGICQQCRA